MSSVFSKIKNSINDFTSTKGDSTPPSQNQQSGDGQQNNNNQNNNNNNQSGDGKPPNPLAAFEKMFDNSTNTETAKPPSFKIDPEVVTKYTEGLDFSDSLTPEILAKLKSGDDSGYKDLVNSLGRKMARTSLESHTALTERFVDARSQHDRSGLGKSINSQLTKNSLEKLAANNPLVKKQLDVVAEELMKSNPDATPEWIAEQTPKYFLEMARQTNPEAFKNMMENSSSANSKDKQSNVDWDEWLSKK